MAAQRRVTVVGGGISGLATAYYLSRRQEGAGASAGASAGVPTGASARGPIEVTLLEAGPELGGRISTETVAGLPIDAGPDAILARSPLVAGLLTDLGLLDDLSRPASRRAYVWTRGRLRPLPPMSLFGVPETPLPLLRSRLLSPWGALRAGADFVLPRSPLPADPTIAELLRPRFGREVFEQLIEPLLGGVHAGRADALSARSSVPEVYLAARGNRSTYLALRHRAAAGGARSAAVRPNGDGTAGNSAVRDGTAGNSAAKDGAAGEGVARNGPAPARPTAAVSAGARSAAGRTIPNLGMVSVAGGLQHLVDTFVAAMPQARVRTNAAVTGIARTGDGLRLDIAGGDPVHTDAVVLATPAPVTADLLVPHSAVAASALRAIPYVGVATVMLGYRREQIGRPLDGTGFLVPPREGRMIVGCTWSTAKWEHLRDDEVTVLRCAVGRDGDTRWEAMSDAEIVSRVRAELAESMQVRGEPTEVVVRRWPDSMPQYTVGHERRLVTLARELHDLPGIHVTGAAYRGVGIAGCLTQAAGVADAVAASLDGEVPSASGAATGTQGG
ncbi:MAG: protoporphyrinogen oxidase [Kineosporiaceae bacterium]